MLSHTPLRVALTILLLKADSITDWQQRQSQEAPDNRIDGHATSEA